MQYSLNIDGIYTFRYEPIGSSPEIDELADHFGKLTAEINRRLASLEKRAFSKDVDHLDQIFTILLKSGSTDLKTLSDRTGFSRSTLKRLMPQLKSDKRFKIIRGSVSHKQKIIISVKTG